MKILFDFFPVLLFFVAYKMYGFFVGTAVAIGATFVQVGLFWLKYRRFETTHLVVLAIVTLFGGATLLLDDPIFFKWKPGRQPRKTPGGETRSPGTARGPAERRQAADRRPPSRHRLRGPGPRRFHRQPDRGRIRIPGCGPCLGRCRPIRRGRRL